MTTAAVKISTVGDFLGKLIEVSAEPYQVESHDNNPKYAKRLEYFKREFKATGMDLIPASFLDYCTKYSFQHVKKGLFFFGGTGTGKTSRAVFIKNTFGIKLQIANILFEAYKTDGPEYALELSKVSLNNRLDSYSPFSEDLIIDELGAEPASANIFGTTCYPLAEIIEQRYLMFSRHGALTHFTSNKSLPEMREVYGERAFSRLNEMCYKPIGITGNDRRIVKTA
ncbi:MAG: hypothetical protein WCI51_07145 [Lentisphaerota bacterium]